MRSRIRPAKFRVGPKVARPKVVAKVRRTAQQAYGDNWRAMCEYIKRRDGYRCCDCGRATKRLHVHHIVPISRGGLTVAYNLKSVCEPCHEKKPFHGHMVKQRRWK